MKTETSYREQMWIWETIHRLHQAAVKELFCSCRSLVDTVYSLKDEVQELKQVSLQFPRYMTNTDFSVLSRGEGQNQKAWCVLNSYEKLMISVDVKQSLLWYMWTKLKWQTKFEFPYLKVLSVTLCAQYSTHLSTLLLVFLSLTLPLLSLSRFVRTTRGWGGRWRRSSERGKSWRGLSGEFWRTWTTRPGTRRTSEVRMCLIIDRPLKDQMTDEVLFNLCGQKLPTRHAAIQHVLTFIPTFMVTCAPNCGPREKCHPNWP